MKKENKSLSEKINIVEEHDGYELEVLFPKDIKEFIKIISQDLKEEGKASLEDFDDDTLAFSLNDVKEIIKKRAGEKLIC